MPAWPDSDDVEGFMGTGAVNPDAMAFALPAAIERIRLKCGIADDVAEVSDLTRSLTMLQASRWYKRKDSVDGIAGSNEYGAIRVTRLDPDIEAMLEPLQDWSIG